MGLIYFCRKSFPFHLDLDKSKSLICFQCNSSNEILPLCRRGYFHLNKPWRTMNLSFQCPPHRADYCFLQEKYADDVIITARGCYGHKDQNGNDIRTGCTLRDNNLLCFCKSTLCNSSFSQFGFRLEYPFLIFGGFFLKSIIQLY